MNTTKIIAQYRKEMRLYAVGSFMYNWYKDAIMKLRTNSLTTTNRGDTQ